jgi:potassium channel subfamily K
MGEDENSSKFHRKAPVKERGGSDGSHIASAANDVNEEQDVGEENKWSWLGARSPLMGDTEEAEWVLERLSLTLERELKKQRDQQKGADTNMKDEGLKKDPRHKDSDGDRDKDRSTEPLTRGSSATIDGNS